MSLNEGNPTARLESYAAGASGPNTRASHGLLPQVDLADFPHPAPVEEAIGRRLEARHVTVCQLSLT